MRKQALALLISTCLLGAVTGCSIVPWFARANCDPVPAPSPYDSELVEFRVVAHCHSHLSHDSEGKIEDIAAAAVATGIQAVLLTDHYVEGNIAASPRGLVNGVLFVPGVELGWSGGGSLLAFGVAEDWDRSLPPAEVASGLLSGGAVLTVGHVEEVEDFAALSPYVSSFEVYNLHAEVEAWGVGSIVWRFLFLGRRSFFESLVRPPTENLERLERQAREHGPLGIVAGHDAHENVRLFGRLGGVIGTYRELFALFSTRVLARDLSEGSIVDAIRQGRTFVVFDYVGPVASGEFALAIAPSPGDEGAIVHGSGEVPFQAGQGILVRSPPGGVVRVLRDGVLLREIEGRDIRVPVPGPGDYRVEVWRDERFWILSGILRVGERPVEAFTTEIGGAG